MPLPQLPNSLGLSKCRFETICKHELQRLLQVLQSFIVNGVLCGSYREHELVTFGPSFVSEANVFPAIESDSSANYQHA